MHSFIVYSDVKISFSALRLLIYYLEAEILQFKVMCPPILCYTTENLTNMGTL